MKRMKKKYALFFFLLFILSLLNCSNNSEGVLEFIAAADMRYLTTGRYKTDQHFLGTLKAIKKVGKGSFMIIPGDLDPPANVAEIIAEVLGPGYPWYPAPGNHDMDSEKYIQWLKKYNDALPHIVRTGPPGSEKTTYAFEWGDCHFVALNQYYDGKSLNGTDGDIVAKLYEWLAQDLAATTKKNIFIFGHEPMVAMPDMDNGRLRHQRNSLDKYPQNLFRFMQLLLKYKVKAYICGHTHSVSFSMINGLWQLDLGHARGIEEDSTPDEVFTFLKQSIKQMQGVSTDKALEKYFEDNKKQVKKTLFYSKLVANISSYKKIKDKPAIRAFKQFYFNVKDSDEYRTKINKIFWENCQYRKSSFMKFVVTKDKVRVEIYRDDARGGQFSRRQVLIL